MAFTPIAIIGRGCIVPGANTPRALWEAIASGKNLITTASRTDDKQRSGDCSETNAHRFISPVTAPSGFVSGFEACFDPNGFLLPTDRVLGYDRSLQWLLEASRQAVREAGYKNLKGKNSAVVLGNLSYPSRSLVDITFKSLVVQPLLRELACDNIPQISESEAEERFSSGRPAHMLAAALGINGPAFALDAACASSLYAIKYACDLLTEGSVDVALAAAMNGADKSLLHHGFLEIKALSPTGCSKPFSRSADGLVPAEGAAVICLKRLDDAQRDNDNILGLIRGAGLSNDGRQRGLLSPDAEAQTRAIRMAYDVAELDPKSISLLECHATGTPVGDGVEIISSGDVFGEKIDLPVGSLKSNLGHLMAVAGIASVIKVLAAMEAQIMPPTLHADDMRDEFADSPLRPLCREEPWNTASVRRAGINNFGFGGNNAHLILEEKPATGLSYPAAVPVQPPADDIVICGIGIRYGSLKDTKAFNAYVNGNSIQPPELRAELAHLPLTGIKFPPADMKTCLGQQTLIFETVLQSLAGIKPADPIKSGIFIGMGCDANAARPEGSLGIEAFCRNLDLDLPKDKLKDFVDSMEGIRVGNQVLSTMPNLPANRLNVQLDWRGVGFTVSSEELSGFAGVALAVRALQNRELDMAVAGAVDVSADQIHKNVLSAMGLSSLEVADAAVSIVLKRKENALRDGDPIIAEIAMQPTDNQMVDKEADPLVIPELATAHAAHSMIRLAATIGCASTMVMRAEGDLLAQHLNANRKMRPVTATSFTGQQQSVYIKNISAYPASGSHPIAPFMFYAAANSREELIKSLADGQSGGQGTWKLAITAENQEKLNQRIQASLKNLKDGKNPFGPCIYFRNEPMHGKIAFAYPGIGTLYPGMDMTLLEIFPDIRIDLQTRYPAVSRQVIEALTNNDEIPQDHATRAKILTYHSVFMTQLLQKHLGVEPDICLGISQGEANMIAAMDVWENGMPDIIDHVVESGFYTELAGDHPLIAQHWKLPSHEAPDWLNIEIVAPIEKVEDAVKDFDRVYITIVNSPEQCLIGGQADQCRAVMDRLGGKCGIESNTDLAWHGTFAAAFGDRFYDLHHHPIKQIPDCRFYFNASHKAVDPDSDRIADQLRHQGINRVDFPPTVQAAWNDGARIFIDIGPRAGLATAISAALKDQDHITVAADRSKRDALRQIVDMAATLYALGVPVNMAQLDRRVTHVRQTSRTSDQVDKKPQFDAPVHMSEVAIPRPIEATPKRQQSMTNDADKPKLELVAMARPSTRNTWVVAAPAEDSVNRNPVQAAAQIMTAPVMRAAPASEPETDGPMTLEQSKIADFPGAKAEAMQKNVTLGEHTGSCVKPLDIIEPTGPTFNRSDLEIHAGGRISEIFGSLFHQQDGHSVQCRMPQPPLLLADRVTGITGEPGSMGKGICWTETDVTHDSWYLSQDRMRTGVVIESGQADLFLASWLGVDFLNKGQRAYRLLGCEITFHEGDLPKPGDTLKFQIQIEGHANLGDQRLFFFQYDARIGDRLLSSVRNGQAGFFTAQELANATGVLWEAKNDQAKPDAIMDPTPLATAKRAFSDADILAFCQGDAYTCFGDGFTNTAAHTRTPRIPGGRMRMVDRVVEFDPTGGPWQRGYLKAEFNVPADAWFYDGHFKNDPCMPGTLMAEAAAQALQVYMAALGLTIERDGWRFSPATNEAFKFECRGQVIPDKAHLVTYEIFVEEVIVGSEPTVYAALVARSDGFKVFMCRRFGMKLVRDWLLEEDTIASLPAHQPTVVSPTGDVRGDIGALIACCQGKPSVAFGSMYAKFDHGHNIPRLPQPPYFFMSEVVSVDCDPAKPTENGTMICKYHVPADAWYFDDGGNEKMPFSVLTECFLQPCGWLASYMGFALGPQVKFRNLDGQEVIVHKEIGRDEGTLEFEVKFTRSAQAGPMVIVFYEVLCRSDGQVIGSLKTDFGFFPPDALKAQKGLPVKPEHREQLKLEQQKGQVDSSVFQDTDAPKMPADRLLMVDQVSYFSNEGGPAGLGRAIGQQEIDPHSWYFKAHFWEDPVQPGSLGLEAIYNLFKAAVKLKGLHKRFSNPRFEGPAIGETLEWAYRGQIVPTNTVVTTEFDITEIVDEGDTILVRGSGSLWVDELRGYEVKNYSLRIRESALEKPGLADDPMQFTLDLDKQPYLLDHCPSYVIPTYPAMGFVGKILHHVSTENSPVVKIENLEINSWILYDGGRNSIAIESEPITDTVSQLKFISTQQQSGIRKNVGRVRVTTADHYEQPPVAWEAPMEILSRDDPYASGNLFHDTAFQLARSVNMAATSSVFEFSAQEAIENADGDWVILADALLHGIPHQRPQIWFGDRVNDLTCFPYRIDQLSIYAAPPETGTIHVVSRALKQTTARTVLVGVQASYEGRVFLEMTVTEALCPLDGLLRMSPASVRDYFRNKAYFEGWCVSEQHGGTSTLTKSKVKRLNWLPGTLEMLYGLSEAPITDQAKLTEQIALKDYFATRLKLHPAHVQLTETHVVIADRNPVALDQIAYGWISDEAFQVGK